MNVLSWVQHPLAKAFFPIPILALLALVATRLFRQAWQEIESDRSRDPTDSTSTTWNSRSLAVVLIAGFCLTFQRYYGHRDTYERYLQATVSPALDRLFHAPAGMFHELYGHGWWSFARALVYVVFPLTAWKILYPRDRLRAIAGLSWGGLWPHRKVYGLCLAVIFPCLLLASTQPDFHNHYPFYKQASRSWLDLALWEALYLVQFFCLEVFFRGWWLQALRPSLGVGALFSMLVPYGMIHFGKPYLEANGALLAGLVLGTLAMQSRSIYGGFAVHAFVAVVMDFLALRAGDKLPTIGVPW